MIKKYITYSGLTYKIGDFFEEEPITSFSEKSHQIIIHTSSNQHTFDLKTGDYISYEDGSGKIVKSKYDKQDE